MNRDLIHKIIFVACTLLLVYSIASTSIFRIEPTGLGLTTELPLIYYIGMLLLGCVWYVGFKSRSYLPLALILTFSYLYVAPALIRVPVWISNSYYPYGESLSINSAGHLIKNPAAGFVSYDSWPLFLYFASAFTMITNLPHYVILKFFPLLSVGLYALFAFFILKTKLPVQHAFLGSAILLAGLFIRQQYFGPQGLAYFFFLAILLVVSLMYFDKASNPSMLLALLISLFVITTILHPLTSFIALAVPLALYLADRFSLKRFPSWVGLLFVGASAVWLIYNFFYAKSFFNTAIQHFYEILTGSRGISVASESARPIGSTAMLVNFLTSYALVGLAGIVALLSMFVILRKLRSKRSEIAYPIFMAILLILFTIFAFVGEYGAEAYQRAFMFGLVPIGFLAISLLRSKPRVLIVFVMVLIFLNVPAQYGSDTFRLATNSQLTGAAFVAYSLPQNVKLVGEFTIYIRYFVPTKYYQVLDIGLSLPFSNIPNATVLYQGLKNADYVLVSDSTHNHYVFYIGRDPLEEVDFGQFNKLYDNGGFKVFQPARNASLKGT